MTKIRVLGITIQRNIQWDRNFCIMGFGDIAIAGPEVTMRGCALARSSSGKIIALPPKIPGAKLGDLNAIQWNATGEFALRVRDMLLEAYQKMGGPMPPSTPEKAQNDSSAKRRIAEKHDSVPQGDDHIRRDHVTGKPIGPDPFEADAERARKDRPSDMPADALEQAERAVEHARRHAVARTSDDDDTSGLHRVLGVGAVEETMARAGL